LRPATPTTSATSAAPYLKTVLALATQTKIPAFFEETTTGCSSSLKRSHEMVNDQNEDLSTLVSSSVHIPAPSNQTQPKRQRTDPGLTAPPTSHDPSPQCNSSTHLLPECAFTRPDYYTLDKSQTTIGDAITKLGMIAMQKIISTCMKNLEPSRPPGITPPWWPAEVKFDQLTHLKKEGKH
jgi:hypothetical protein